MLTSYSHRHLKPPPCNSSLRAQNRGGWAACDLQLVILVLLVNIVHKEEVLLDFVELSGCSTCCYSSCQQAPGQRAVLAAC